MRTTEGKNRKSELRSILQESSRLYIEGKHDTASKLNELAIKMANELRDSVAMAQCLVNKATDSYHLGDVSTSKQIIEKAFEICKNIKNDTILAELNYWMGTIITSEESIINGWPYLLEAEALYKIAGDFRFASSLYVSMAFCYSELQNYDKANDYYNRAMKIAIKKKQTRKTKLIRAQIAYEYILLDSTKGVQMLTSAIHAFDSSITNSRQNIKTLVEGFKVVIANTYLENGDYDSAETVFNEILRISNENDFKKGLACAYYGLAKLAFLKNKIGNAERALKMAEVFSDEKNAFNLFQKYKFKKEINLLLADLYERKKSNLLAIRALERSDQYNDSLREIKLQIATSRFEIETLTQHYNFNNESQRKKNKVLLSSLEGIRKDQLYLFIGIILCFMMGLSLWTMLKKYYRIKTDLISHNINLDLKLNKGTEKVVHAVNELQSKCDQQEQFAWIVSHLLRAPLASIMGIVNLNGKINVEKTDELVRLLTVPRKQLISIKGILTQLTFHLSKTNTSEKEYCHINEIFKELVFIESNKQNVRVSLSIDGNVELVLIDKRKISEILQVVISNSIKYCSLGQDVELSINSRMEKNNLFILLTDNSDGIDMVSYGSMLFFPGRRFHHSSDGLGLGLFMLKELLQLIGGSVVLCSELGKGTSIRLTIPI